MRFTDGYPPAETVPVTRDFKVCGDEKVSEEFVVDPATKGLENVVVSLADVKRGKPFAEEEVSLTQKACAYTPHVLLVPAGQPFKILNEDGLLHNFHTYGKANPPINRAQPKHRTEMTVQLDHPETVLVGCDIHNWMSAQIVVEDSPYYAVTDETGAFELDDVPPGDYDIIASHEGVGEMRKKVSVAPGGTAEVAFRITPR